MNKGIKIALIIAGALILLGIILCVIALALNGFKPFQLGKGKLVDVEKTVTEDFSSITVECADSDVQLLPSSDGTCRIVGKIAEKQKLTVSVSNGTLKVKVESDRKWYDLFASWPGDAQLKLYLPEETYDELSVFTASGNVTVGTPFTFKDASFHTASGDLSFSAQAEKTLTMETASGDCKIRNLNGTADLKFSSASGDLEITDTACSGCTVNTASGDVDLNNVLAENKLDLQTVSGEVELKRCDGETILIQTVSGDVEGTLLSGKTFRTSTVSGDVRVPSDEGSGSCKIDTTSGDISIKIAN